MQVRTMLGLGAAAIAAPLAVAGSMVATGVAMPGTGPKGPEENAGYPLESGRAPYLWQAVQGAATLASSAAARIRPADMTGTVAPNPGSSAKEDADAAWRALSASTEVRGMPGAYAAVPGGNHHASVWAMSQVLNAALDRAGSTGDWADANAITQRLASLYGKSEAWSDGLSIMPKDSEFGHHPFYDDNAWLVLDLLQAHEMTGDETWLKRAEEMLPFLEQGLQEDGGVLWGRDEPHPSVSTCSTGPVGQVYAKLYAATGDPAHLEKAQRIETYLSENLLMDNGMYGDNIDLASGRLTDWQFSYNQGTPIGLQVELYRATGDEAYLEKATKTAKASVEEYSKGNKLWEQPPVFNTIYFRNLLALDAVAPDPSYRKLLDDYLDRATSEGLDRTTGLYKNAGMGSYDGKSAGAPIDQAAMVQMFELQAGGKTYR